MNAVTDAQDYYRQGCFTLDVFLNNDSYDEEVKDAVSALFAYYAAVSSPAEDDVILFRQTAG